MAPQGPICDANAALSAQKASKKSGGGLGTFDLASKIFYLGWKAATEALIFEGHYLVINNQGRRSGPKWPPGPYMQCKCCA